MNDTILKKDAKQGICHVKIIITGNNEKSNQSFYFKYKLELK